MSYSSFVRNRSSFAYGAITLLSIVILVLQTIIHKKEWMYDLTFLTYLWTTVYYMVSTFYIEKRFWLSSVPKVYIFYITFQFWLSDIYTLQVSTINVFAIVFSYVMMPIIVAFQVFYAFDTNIANYRQRNVDFMVNLSFLINTLFFLLWIVLKSILSSHVKDQIVFYLLRWMTIMIINSVISSMTILWRKNEQTIECNVSERTWKNTQLELNMYRDMEITENIAR